MTIKPLRYVVIFATLFALIVVMLGAYTRLTDAGLGCPDWPGCYGKIVLPSASPELISAQHAYPDIPIESRKAWTEMAHRYAAGTLVMFVLFTAFSVFRRRESLPKVIPAILLLLIGFQAALGMWTVTLKLLPLVVMGHLLGGIVIFSCLVYLCWQLSPFVGQDLTVWRRFIVLGMMIVFCQIALGGWVSSNYAGIACVGFPQCNGDWLPHLHFSKSFNLFAALGVNYQGGLLDSDARVTIQMVHRLGAWITASYLLVLSVGILWRVSLRPLRLLALLMVFIVVIQFSLGVINVTYLLPLWVSVAHNGVAAVLLATLASMRYFTTKGVVYAR